MTSKPTSGRRASDIGNRVMGDILRGVGAEPGTRLFRNNVGVARFPGGAVVAYGLCPGSSDLIGWRTIEITPEMVGKRVAVFAAVEAKGPKATPSSEQKAFIRAVRAAGGIAGVAHTADEARELLEAAT